MLETLRYIRCFVLQKLKFYVCPLIVDRNQPISARELTQSDCKKNRTFKNGVASVIRDLLYTLVPYVTEWLCVMRLPWNIGTKVEVQNPLS